MTKEQKQMILIVVLSVTLYAVWPSGPNKSGKPGDLASVSPLSDQESDRANPNSVRMVSSVGNNPVPTNGEFASMPKASRHRWELDEILQMQRSRPKHSVTTRTHETGGLEAIYFTSPSATSSRKTSPEPSKASAIVGGKLVKPGEPLRDNRIVQKIQQDRIEIAPAN